MKYLSQSSVKWLETPIWLRVIWIIAIVNFTSFWITSVLSGGDAINGKVESGKYFIMSHGRYTEASKLFFDYSRIHTYSVWVTHSAAFISALLFYSRRKNTLV